jgi:hypothetical protein
MPNKLNITLLIILISSLILNMIVAVGTLELRDRIERIELIINQ